MIDITEQDNNISKSYRHFQHFFNIVQRIEKSRFSDFGIYRADVSILFCLRKSNTI